MATITANSSIHSASVAVDHADQVSSILRWTYGLVPIAAGADKFAHVLTDWDQYLAPAVTNIIPVQPHTFMSIAGVIEIIAGIIVLVKPKIGSIIVALWLIAIVINLLLTGKYYDIAVRDTVMAIGAFCLYLLLHDKKEAS